MNFIPSNGWPQLKDIPEKLEHFREVYARFAKVNRWYQSIEETELTGNPVIFEKALKLNATALSLNMLPIQSGSGDPSPENVRPISGRTEVNLGRTGKNLFDISNYTTDGAAVSVTDNKVIFTNSNYVAARFPVDVVAGQAYTFSFDVALTSGSAFIGAAVGSTNRFSQRIDASGKTVINYTATQTETLNIAMCGASSTSTGEFSNIQFEVGNTATPYEPYITPVTLTIALGTTVYGGNLDVKTGMLTIDRASFVVDDNVPITKSFNTRFYVLSTDITPSPFVTGANNYDLLCDKLSNDSTKDTNVRFDAYGNLIFTLGGEGYPTTADFREAYGDIQIAYKLATAQTIQLTGAELALLMGYNYISTDADRDRKSVV